MIKLFCKGLPWNLSQLLYAEYQNRLKEFRFLLENFPNKYRWIEDHEPVELILAMSIFYRRVIAQFDAAKDFTVSLLKRSECVGVSFGQFTLDENQADSLSKIVNGFSYLLYKFGLDEDLFDYDDVEGFLIQLKRRLEVRKQ